MGKYARMRLWYLKEHQPALYTPLLFSGKLDEHLSEIETSAQDMMESIVQDLSHRHLLLPEIVRFDFPLY